MNKFFKYFVCATIVTLGFTACVQDLDLKPLDKNTTTAFNQDAVFTKCYATLALTGQTGPDGDCDIDDLDEGTSSFYRMHWELNEFPTDEGWWIWNDVGLADIRIMNWNGDNALVKGLYYRFNIDIKLCNHFLAHADVSTPEGQAQAAEVRFLRALNYWYILDMFKVAPFSIEESTDYPKFVERAELYGWLVDELEELTELLPEQRYSIYRVDRYAAWLLLARTYLNAKVYLNKSWNDEVVKEAVKNAYDAASHALEGHYQLLTTPTDHTGEGGWYYSAYQKLFMGDNHANGAQDEALLLIYQDGVYCQCWGGSRFLLNTFRDANMVPSGSDDSWSCFRSSPELVAKFVNLDQASSIKAHEYEMPEILGDDRAILCSYNKYVASVDTLPDGEEEIKYGENTWNLNGTKSATFKDCWAVLKYTGVKSTAKTPAESVGSDPHFPDTDIPLLRLAEAYMIKAEAALRQGNNGEALSIVNDVIRARANAAPLPSINEATMCDEWCREFYCEGRRRSDLIRFDRFAGPQADAAAYNWEGRYNQTSAAGYKSCAEKWNWYPIPNDDKASNPNYELIEGGDGY